ncbi:uncharacterized protein [Diadema setosum]|uniref:uncharacterized protein n=1 Tax=Diadema setosum TaxID=31175 RepID=UPI003B3B6D99
MSADVKLVSGTPQTIYSAGQVTDTSRQFLVARWRIEAPEGTVIHVRFKQFNLMLGIEHFTIGDGLRPHNRRAYRFELTGSEPPGDLVTVSNRMWIVFSAYTEGLNGTYEVELTPIPKPGDLAPTFVGPDNSVILTSLYYPNDYPNNFYRLWTVETSEQYRIRLKLLDFEMPNDNDGVYVLNGIWYLEDGAIVAFWSGTRDIAFDELTTTVNGISIFLSTDPTDGRRGFKLELSAFTLPVVLTEGEVHELTSPFYPMPYKNNAYIEWTVNVPQGFGILLHFLDFDLIGEGDVLFVRKGENSTGPQTTVQLFTGRDVPLDVIVWETALWIQFSSDEAEIGQGFRLELRPIFGEGHCLIPLGMEAGWIPDSSITATSQKDEDHAPNQARLHGPASWIPHPDEENPIIVVNLGGPHYVTGVLIQGGPNSRGTWLTSVTFSFEDENEEVLQGSWDPQKVSSLFFSRPRLTSVINIKPSSKAIELVSLRFEILGCENDCHFDLWPSSVATSTSSIPVQYLGNGTSYEDLLKIQPLERYPRHGWTPAEENTHPWIELRFDGVLVLRAIIFQQCLGFRLDRFNITTESNESLSLVFVPVDLESSTYRIHPTEWTGSTPCFRVTLLGCISVDCMTTYCTHDCSSEYLVPDIVRTKLETNTRTLPPRALCQRTITASPDNFVTIFLGGFNAIADITGTYDGSVVLSEPEEDRVTTFDPNGIPHIFRSTSSRLLISIHSGLYTLSTNITATYGSVDKPECSHANSDAEQGIFPSCTEAKGIIMSPNYIETYPNNIDRSWQITTKSWTRVKFSFIELDVLSLDSECNEDFVEVIDTSIDRPIGRYCSLHWPVEEVMSSLNWMTVRFHSDSIAGGSGFLGEYESVELLPDVLDKAMKEPGDDKNSKMSMVDKLAFETPCPPGLYQCLSRECVGEVFVCDGFDDCVDSSDESLCPDVYPACREDELTCVSGECIDLSKRCDFIDDCFDSSDESECAYNEDDYSCDPTTQITCKNGACAPLQSHCMYELDEYGLPIGCRDVSHLQSCGNFTCPNFMIKCPSSYCIPLRYWCDGLMDCPYGEDEDQCASFVCPPGSYRCHGHGTCITQDEVCDEVIHCPEKDDELFCDLQNTGLSEIVSGSFLDNGNILHLNLSGNNISRLAQGSLRGLQRLTKLILHGNPLDDVSPRTFYNLSNLQELDVRETSIRLTTSGLNLFHGLQSLKVIHADKYVFCCLSGLTDAEGCKAPRDQFSSCEDLMSNNILRVFIWILGASAFAGNGFVVFYRMFKSPRDSRTSVQSSFITNLAISDFLMGLYMITIAAADVYFRGNYAIHAEAWQSSIVCKVAGMVSVVSSEASVCLIMMISVDRCIHVVAPFRRGLHLTVRRARLTEFTIWSLALLVSILPVVIPTYIEGNFYGQSGVCLALPLTVNRPAGWHYSISLFIGANFVGFFITLLCYIAIYISIKLTKQQIVKRGKGSKVNAHLAEEIKLASKMALIVGTDLICWMPIIIMGLMSAAGKLVISAQVYAWTAVFILPVNSSLNPYLYTLSSLHGTRKSNISSHMDNSKTKVSTIFQESTPSLITPFDPMPNPKPLRMRDWISHNERDLTYGEQQVISRDIASAVESMKEAGFPASRFLQLPEDAIAVQTTENGRIEHAFLVLDSPFLCKDHEGDDHLHQPGEEVGNRAHVMRVMQRVKTLYTNDS